MEMATGTASWFHYGKTALSIRWMLVPDPASNFDTIALLHADDQCPATWIVKCFVLRWQLEVTFEDTRHHLGIESQRQLSNLAIARTTTILFVLFSWMIYLTERLHRLGSPVTAHQSAWYAKAQPAFSDVLAYMRHYLWQHPQTFTMSRLCINMVKVPRPYLQRLIDADSYVA